VTRPTVVIELAGDAQFARDLAVGGVFVPGCTLPLTTECELVVCGAHRQLVLAARVVYVDGHDGAGLELIGFSAEMKAQLAELEPAGTPGLEVIEEPVLDESMVDGAALDEPVVPDDDLGRGGSSVQIVLTELQALDDTDADALPAPLPEAGDDLTQVGAEALAEDEAAEDEAAEAEEDDASATLVMSSLVNLDAPPSGLDAEDDADDRRDPGPAGRGAPRGVHERLRGLTLPAQIKLATHGELNERVVLERLYGKNVWETLLSNPRLTPPEVARIARYGALPRALLEIIVGNNAWLQIPEVRRALLSNPRLAADQIMKILRLVPKHELKLASIQTAYPHAVRSAAKVLIVRDE
jgi:hypothetical protein